MAYKTLPGQGSLFTNKKQKENQPDYSGDININGESYRIAGWKATSLNGVEYIKLKVSVVTENLETKAREEDDDLPL